jgi:hypothetical protein
LQRRGPAPRRWALCVMPTDCEVNECGVLAAGRCSACGKAFCISHAANAATCIVCASQTGSAVSRVKSSGTVAEVIAALVAAGSPGLQPLTYVVTTSSQSATEWQWTTQTVDSLYVRGKGWPLGEFRYPPSEESAASALNAHSGRVEPLHWFSQTVPSLSVSEPGVAMRVYPRLRDLAAQLGVL